MELSSDVNYTLTKKAKYFLTFGCYLQFFAYGFANTLVVSTLLDIKENLGSTFSEASFGLVISAIVHGISFLVFGKLLSYVDKRQVSWIVTLFASLAIFTIPYIKSLAVFYVIYCTYHFMTAGLSIVSQSWLLKLWQENSNPYMQGFHFSYSVGMTLAPLISAPFLSNKTLDSREHNNLTNPLAVSFLNFRSQEQNFQRSFISEGFDFTHLPSLFVPYTIGFFLMFLSSAVILVLIFYENYLAANGTPYRQFDEVEGKSAPANGSVGVRNVPRNRKSNSWFAIILAILICFCYQFSENNAIVFITEFIYYLTGDKKTGSYVATLFSGSYAVSRFLGIFTARFIAAKYMLFGHITVALIFNIPLLIFVSSSVPVLSVIFIFVGIGYSAVFAALYTFFSQIFNMTSQIFSLFLMSASFACILVPLIEGLLLEDNPVTYIYCNLAGLGFALSLLTLLVFVHRKAATSSRGQEDLVNSTPVEPNNNRIEP